MTCGPVPVREEAMDCSGTIVPFELRMNIFQSAIMARRSAASACKFTCQLLPHMIQFLMKYPPSVECSLLKTSLSVGCFGSILEWLKLGRLERVVAGRVAIKQRKGDDRDRVLHLRHGIEDRLGLARSLARPFDRCAIGQLHIDEESALILFG